MEVDYSKRRDDELLRLAADYSALTPHAAQALQGELQRRGIRKSAVENHQRHIKHWEKEDAERRSREPFNPFIRSPFNTRPGFTAGCAVLAVLAIGAIYTNLSDRWLNSAQNAIIVAVLVGIFGIFRWGRVTFWVSLLASFFIQLVSVHAWIERVGSMSSRQNGLAVLLGIALFFLVHALISAMSVETKDDPR